MTWEGVESRECGEHRTTGGRAWCFQDGEWCYPSQLCRGCELPALRAAGQRVGLDMGEALKGYVLRGRQAEDGQIASAVFTGAAQDPPCGVLVERSFENPMRVTLDPTIPPWEVHERSVWGRP